MSALVNTATAERQVAEAFEAGKRAAFEAVRAIADQCDEFARINDSAGENAEVNTTAQRAFGSRDAYTSVAKRIREIAS